MPKIVHFREKCIGCNSCVELASKHWEISQGDGKSNLIGADKKKDVWVKEISLAELPENELAARDCPVRIIKIEK